MNKIFGKIDRIILVNPAHNLVNPVKKNLLTLCAPWSNLKIKL